MKKFSLTEVIQFICNQLNPMAPTSPTFTFSDLSPDSRLAELLLYVASKDCTLGATKLNKVLWFSDMTSYLRRGRAITGVEYMKEKNGPVPRRLVPVRKELLEKGHAVVRPVDVVHYKRHQLVPLRAPDLSKFSATDIAIVDEVIDFLRGNTAKEVSDLSHTRIWRVAGMQESIPYEAFFVSDDNANDDDIRRAKELASQYSWAA